jgi:diaminopimelate epimerase
VVELSEKTTILFDKYEAAGNDFILVDGRKYPLKNPLSFAKQVCRRRFSVGADDVLYLEESNVADIKMRICEPDGSEASMCGNGIRCVAAYLDKSDGKSVVSIETLAGIYKVSKKDNLFEVEFGTMHPLGNFVKPFTQEKILEKEFLGMKFYIVSPGEPHAVTIVEDIEKISIGRSIEIAKNFDIFPDGINVDYVQLCGDHICVRTFERGVWGETFACGTGAVSSAFIARKLIEKNPICVKMKGGKLFVKFDRDKIFLLGEAQLVYNGKLEMIGGGIR